MNVNKEMLAGNVFADATYLNVDARLFRIMHQNYTVLYNTVMVFVKTSTSKCQYL